MPLDMLVAYTNEGRWEVRTLIEDHNCIQSREIKACTSRFLSDHIIKTLATNPDIPVRAVQDQMQKQFDVGVSKMKAFRAKRIATDKITGTKATTDGEFNKKMGKLKSYNSVAYDWLMKIPAEQWSRANFLVQKVIAKTVGPLTPSVIAMFDVIKKWLLIVQWNGGYLYQVNGPYMDQCVVNMDTKVCSCRKWEITGIPCKHVVAAIYNMSENSMGVGIPELWVHAAYRLETWPPKKRKKSYDEIASESCSSGKLSRKGNSVKCSKYGNLGHNTKGCRGQGGASQAGGSSQAGARQAVGARNVSGQAAGSSQAGARQAVGARNVSGQAAGARNASGQAGGSSQPSAAPSTATGARNASSQAAGASQSSATPSTTRQGPTQHSARPRQEFKAPRPALSSRSQRMNKKTASRQSPRKLSY
ncbi:mutator type transposase [Tanacetum coccineum]